MLLRKLIEFAWVVDKCRFSDSDIDLPLYHRRLACLVSTAMMLPFLVEPDVSHAIDLIFHARRRGPRSMPCHRLRYI